MSSSSLSGYANYVSFIDDFSRKTWIYFLKNKDEVFSKLKEFQALIENHTKKKIKTFRSDNGGEFTSYEFKELCRDSGYVAQVFGTRVRGVRGHEYPVRLEASYKFTGNVKLGAAII